MTTPHDFEPVIGDNRGTNPGPGEEGHQQSGLSGLVANMRAVVRGVSDTAKDMLHAGQVEAQHAQDEAWARYDELTRYRRQERQKREAEEADRER